ncbi:hypothetical protein BGZ57DRAFT_387308 [Hyaloscypha finlandica]|nr:hypothetical protein BGZ57DRAFT_387308 [Hyaloscypha finlandica]
MEKPASDTVHEITIAGVSFPATAMTPLQSFTLFPNLPFELRSEIWGYAAHGTDPRVVEVIISSMSFKPKSHTSSPAVLSACRESRESGLKVFDAVCYGVEFTGALINWERDTLYFNTDIESGKRLLTNAKQPDWFEKCRSLALNRVCFYGAVLTGGHYTRFKQLKNVEKLIVVMGADVIGGQPPERTSVHFAIAEAGCDKKYERTGDHLAYALWQLPHIPRGVLVQEVGAGDTGGRNVLEPKTQEVPGSIYHQPATTRIGLLTKGSTAELCASTTIGAEILEIEMARLHRFFAEFQATRMLAELGLETLERRFESLTGHLFPALQQ